MFYRDECDSKTAELINVTTAKNDRTENQSYFVHFFLHVFIIVIVVIVVVVRIAFAVVPVRNSFSADFF